MYNKTTIRFAICDIWNNQSLRKCYQPKPKAEADNTYRDLDYSGYHKNLIQYFFCKPALPQLQFGVRYIRTFAVVQGVQLSNILATQRFVSLSKVVAWSVYPDNCVQSILGKSLSVIVHD